MLKANESQRGFNFDDNVILIGKLVWFNRNEIQRNVKRK